MEEVKGSLSYQDSKRVQYLLANVQGSPGLQKFLDENKVIDKLKRENIAVGEGIFQNE